MGKPDIDQVETLEQSRERTIDALCNRAERAEAEVKRLQKQLEHYPHIAWKWRKWTIGFWTDPDNCTKFGIDIFPLEIVWHTEGYRP